MLLNAPNGLDEILEVYGDIRKYIRGDGTLLPDWERHMLVAIDLPRPLRLSWDPRPVSRMRCHRLLAQNFERVFADIVAADVWHMLDPFGGCFEYRRQRGKTPKLSTHAWGISVDFDPDGNPHGAPLEDTRLGGTDDGRKVLAIFEDHGFVSGATFPKPDVMHQQFARGY